MVAGRIVEQGTHDDLLERQGAYYQLVEAQRISAQKEMISTGDGENDGDDDEELKLKISRSHTSGQGGAPVDPNDKNIMDKLTRSATSKSKSSVALENRPKEKKHNYPLWTLIKMTYSFNSTPKEKALLFIGLCASVICGGGYTVQAFFFAKAIMSLSKPKSEYDHVRTESEFWSGMYLMLAIIEFISYLVQGVSFAYCSECLIHRARDKAFRTMLRQDIGWFDKEENASGSLVSFLSTETTHLAGMSGVTLGTLLSVISTLGSAIIVGIAVGWKLALVCTATIPVLLSCGFLRFWMLARFRARSKKAYEKSASFACEATAAIRTVASLAREQDVLANYRSQLALQAKESIISVTRSSSLYAASQSMTFLCMAVGFWYGGTLIKTHEYDMLKL